MRADQKCVLTCEANSHQIGQLRESVACAKDNVMNLARMVNLLEGITERNKDRALSLLGEIQNNLDREIELL